MAPEHLQLKLKTIPEQPGIYQYFDKEGVIIYVGKAKNLKKRVTSYFVKTQDNLKTRILVKQIIDIQYLVVDTELDALLLENSLIKKYQPKYNIQLKDDKTYPWICIKQEPFPRVFSTRNLVRDGSVYFGPYTNVKMVNTLVQFIKELYQLRTCSFDLSDRNIQQEKYKVCLEYHIGNCKAPCVGKQSKEDYAISIQHIQAILKGQISTVIQYVKKTMLEFAEAYRFEDAHRMKETLELLENYKSKSTIVSPKIQAVDVITAIEDEKSYFVNYLVVSNGAIIHGITLEVQKKLDEKIEDVVLFALIELRERFSSISKEVLTSITIDTPTTEFKCIIPQIGDKKNLVELSLRNAKFYRMDKFKHQKITNPEEHSERILRTIQRDLRLAELPKHMECFDNSNIQGTNPVSACVVFKDGKPSKKDYRHFNVQTVVGPDDFATMEEAVFRRYRRLLDENESLPQLIIIDGGKGQLGAALKALEKLNLRGKIAIVGIAKRLEEIFFPGDSIPIYLDKRSESLKVIQFMRNEAHRFGITHHRNRRSKGAFVSELEGISGIGEATFQKLMTTFKSLAGIKKASKEALEQCVGKSKTHVLLAYYTTEN